MKIGIFLIAGLIAVIGARALAPAQNADDKAHQQWLEARYKEAASIQPGMTRAELMKLFIEDGGMQMNPVSRYVLKSCYLIKIEVKFDKPAAYSSTPNNEMKIVEVSKPYLEHMTLD
ncbi:MAG TPA: hypothetical protein VE969_00250 [Pyrinomonadaceae bacterium]|nr:hypothetical protein [Pyrinomonadaceae bacterium]